jgi:hypothetical protein
MEKSCSNCLKSEEDFNWCWQLEKVCDRWQPGYCALEQENAELKQQLEKLQNEKAAYELLYHTTERHLAWLTQSLERAWIKCSEQLPEDDCTVFFTNGKFISYGYYSKNFNIEGKKIIPLPREWISEQGLVVDCEITHWQKFYPEPPKEATQ